MLWSSRGSEDLPFHYINFREPHSPNIEVVVRPQWPPILIFEVVRVEPASKAMFPVCFKDFIVHVETASLLEMVEDQGSEEAGASSSDDADLQRSLGMFRRTLV